MARPSKFTESRKRIILEALSDGQTYQVAATMAGVSAGTLSGWLKDVEKREFFDSCKASEAQAEAKLVSCVHEHAGNDWKAAKWLLARRYSHWREVPIQEQKEDVSLLSILNQPMAIEHVEETNESRPTDETSSTEDAGEVRHNTDGQGNGRVSQPDVR